MNDETPRFTDAFGAALNVGDTVIKAGRYSSSMWIEKRTVQRIENGKLYLDDSKGQPVHNFKLLAKVPVANGNAAAEGDARPLSASELRGM